MVTRQKFLDILQSAIGFAGMATCEYRNLYNTVAVMLPDDIDSDTASQVRQRRGKIDKRLEDICNAIYHDTRLRTFREIGITSLCSAIGTISRRLERLGNNVIKSAVFDTDIVTGCEMQVILSMIVELIFIYNIPLTGIPEQNDRFGLMLTVDLAAASLRMAYQHANATLNHYKTGS